jgi:hypothetical protein
VSQFNFKGQLVRSSDSSNTALNYSVYTYDAGGLLQTIETTSQAYAYQTRATEKHLWFYKEGKPERMLNIKNNSDTTEVKFVQDEKGNIAEEEWVTKGKLQEKYYYYYNEANQLTDIVRFNEKARRLLPDFLFEYTTTGLLQQMIAVQSGSSNYLIWNYEYNEKGNQTKESYVREYIDSLGNAQRTILNSESMKYEYNDLQIKKTVYNNYDLPYKYEIIKYNELGFLVEREERYIMTMAVTTVKYNYNEKGYIASIASFEGSDILPREESIYQYDDFGNLLEKHVYRNGTFTTEFEMIYNEKSKLLSYVLTRDVSTNFIMILGFKDYEFFN